MSPGPHEAKSGSLFSSGYLLFRQPPDRTERLLLWCHCCQAGGKCTRCRRCSTDELLTSNTQCSLYTIESSSEILTCGYEGASMFSGIGIHTQSFIRFSESNIKTGLKPSLSSAPSGALLCFLLISCEARSLPLLHKTDRGYPFCPQIPATCRSF